MEPPGHDDDPNYTAGARAILVLTYPVKGYMERIWDIIGATPGTEPMAHPIYPWLFATTVRKIDIVELFTSVVAEFTIEFEEIPKEMPNG